VSGHVPGALCDEPTCESCAGWRQMTARMDAAHEAGQECEEDICYRCEVVRRRSEWPTAPKEYPVLKLRGGPAGHDVEVWLDGKRVESCTALSFAADMDGPAKATLTLIVRVDCEVKADVAASIEDP